MFLVWSLLGELWCGPHFSYVIEINLTNRWLIDKILYLLSLVLGNHRLIALSVSALVWFPAFCYLDDRALSVIILPRIWYMKHRPDFCNKCNYTIMEFCGNKVSNIHTELLIVASHSSCILSFAISERTFSDFNMTLLVIVITNRRPKWIWWCRLVIENIRMKTIIENWVQMFIGL